jgi:phosphoenolpyruvate synthase/pyruvate phosphate dikinase
MKRAAAIITDRGGRTSHYALARITFEGISHMA